MTHFSINFMIFSMHSVVKYFSVEIFFSRYFFTHNDCIQVEMNKNCILWKFMHFSPGLSYESSSTGLRNDPVCRNTWTYNTITHPPAIWTHEQTLEYSLMTVATRITVACWSF